MPSSVEPNDPLERLAARIADDEPVDWQQARGRAAHAAALAGLRELERVVHGFRHAQLAHGEAPRAGRFRFGQLVAIEPLGEGSQGTVWRAYDPLLDLEVALKLRKIESGALAHAFLEEARRLARVRQANIVSVYGAAVHDGQAGLWTELVRGTSLAELLARHGPFPAEEVRGIGLDLAHALAAVHRHGLRHGDVKPENVMREVSGRIVLMDFGAARELDAANAPVVSGSLPYLAPEVLRGAAPTAASDLYALGVLLFRLLTGTWPYPADDLAGLLRAQDEGRRLRLTAIRRDVPRPLARAIEAALALDPARRPASALAFAALLAPPAPRFGGWRVVALAAGLAALVAAGVGLGVRREPAWQTELAFYRAEAHGSSALADGAAIRLGDRLSLALRSSRPVWVYIFDDDGSGDAAVLFPLAGLEPNNPLAADRAYRLPGASTSGALTWQVSRAAAREQFIVIAADRAQPALERAVAVWQHAAEAPATRGALALAPAPPAAELSSPALRAALDEVQRSDGAHVRRFTFTFPHAAE